MLAQARVCDFGISRIVDQEFHNDVKSMGFVNVFGLSVQYAAPEVFSHMQASGDCFPLFDGLLSNDAISLCLCFDYKWLIGFSSAAVVARHGG